MRTQAQVTPWGSPRARALIAAGDVAGLIRWARRERGWRQLDLGRATGYSASAVSRLEGGHRPATDLDMLRRFASALGIPADVLGAAAGLTPSPAATVAPTRARQHQGEEEDPMRRRTLLQAASLPVPSQALAQLDEALALLPAPRTRPTAANVSAQLRRARSLFDIGAHRALVTALPQLLATAQAHADEDPDPAAYAHLAACYDLATEALSKIGQYPASRLTADRSTTYARLSGSPLAQAASARALSIVLRHQDRQEAAQRITLHAAARVEATGLVTGEQAAVFAQMLCTTSYAAAQAGDRDRALEMIRNAEDAAKRLPQQDSGRPVSSVTPASVTLYRVGVLWSLGDAGAAVHAGSGLHPGQFPTAERRGRLHTDMARAWWQWGKPEQTAQQLLAAFQEAPSEVRDRPAIRTIATDLTRRHPRASGVRELTHALNNGPRRH